MTLHDQANARALKAALMELRIGHVASRSTGVAIDENEAEAIVAMAIRHLVPAGKKA